MSRVIFALSAIIAIVAAAATVALAWAVAGIGVPVWQAAAGPLLLAAFLFVRLRRRRS